MFLLLVVIVIAIKTIPIRDELAPFQFCDETIWLNEVSQMIRSGSLVPQEFRSGSLSILPVFLAVKFCSFFFQRNLSENEITVMARVLLIVFGSALTLLFFRRILEKLQIKSWLLIPAGAVLLLNPTQLSFSRYWYPDHFIVLPSTIFLLACVRIIIDRNTSLRSYAYVGLAFALIVSTKYTAVSAAICFLPLVTVGLNKVRRSTQIKTATIRLLTVFGFSVTSFSLINYGIFFHYSKFVLDFKFNLQNYSQLAGGIVPLQFYAWMLIVAPFGLFGLPWIVLGMRSIWNSSRTLLITILPFLMILLIGLARSGLTTSRNIAIGLPFITLFLVVGINQWTSDSFVGRRSFLAIRISLPFLMLSPIAAESLRSIQSDIQTDSRDQAVTWVRKNIPTNVSLGSNEFCSGLSPGDVAGFKTTIDPTFSLRLDYYLLNSYWDSPLSPYYQSHSNQKFFHFYRLKNSSVPFRFPNLDKTNFIPRGYEIIKVLSGDGPEIIVLRRNS